MQTIKHHRRCRVCQGDLEEVLNLGNLHLNAFPKHPGEISKLPTVPHVLAVCTQCSLAQLAYTTPPDWMYREYWYRSGVNEEMIAELREVVRHARSLVSLTTFDHVLDIGANDGTLLSMYRTGDVAPVDVIRVGVDPAINLQDRLYGHCDTAICDYFPTNALQSAVYTGTFKIISAIACCYDLEDPRAFFTEIRRLLHPDGVCLLQFQDFAGMLECAAFDNIGPEHLEYYTLGSLLRILREVGLDATDCQGRAINGGSLRVTVRHTGWVMKYDRRLTDPIGSKINSVQVYLAREERLGLGVEQITQGSLSAFTLFRHRVGHAKAQISAAVAQILDSGTTMDVLGASTKGNVTLQVLGLGPEQVRQAIDRSPEKAGLYTVTGIPIVGEDDEAPPSPVQFVAIWQFRRSLLKRYRAYLQQGGTLLFPLPGVEVVQETWRSER